MARLNDDGTTSKNLKKNLQEKESRDYADLLQFGKVELEV